MTSQSHTAFSAYDDGAHLSAGAYGRRVYDEIWRPVGAEAPVTIGVPITARESMALTERECSVLQLLSHGFSNKEAAIRLGISPETVKSHVKNIFEKLQVDRRAQAVARALGLGVITTV